MRTRDFKKAIQVASTLIDGLEREWINLRFGLSNETPVTDLLIFEREKEPVLSESCLEYCRLKRKLDDRKFRQLSERVTTEVIALSGDKALSAYTIHDAKMFRDTLQSRGVTASTMKRNFAVIRSIWNLSAREHGIASPNPFSNMNFGSGAVSLKREPIPLENIRMVQSECLRLDDDIRWLIALISDTGMRLAEAAGLIKGDVIIDAEMPFIRLVEHSWRPLKTRGSNREIPLVGAALWAAKRAKGTGESEFLFPRYCTKMACKAGYASNTLNKWMKPHVPDGCVIHSFRHSLRDRLRTIECPSDIIDQIGGWATTSVGQNYGDGYPLQNLYRWMKHLE